MKGLSLFILLITTFWSFGQNYGNEWIDYNQQYYKFPITETGVYQITFSSMIAAGIPASSINPSDFQVYGREKELPLRVVDGGDNSFDAGDYIEFFAEGNDGWLDSNLYDDPNTIGNPSYSLYNDTIYYFLSWGSGVNKRYTSETDINFSIYTPRDYFLQKSTRNYNSNFYGGYNILNSYSSYYEPGEGWGGTNLNGASGANLTIGVSTPNPYTGVGAPPVQFQGKSQANSNAAFTGSGNHHLRWEVGTSNLLLYDEVFIGFRQTIVNEPFSVTNLNNGTTNVFFKIIGDQGAATDYQSVNYVQLIYPRSPNLNNQSFADFTIENNSSQAKNRYDFSNANLVNPRCFVTGGLVPRSIPMVQNGGLWQVLIPNAGNGANQRVVIASQSAIKPVQSLSPVNGSGYFTNFNIFNFESAYLIFYNKILENGANLYKDYRLSSDGGSYNAINVDVDELYLQFGGGIPKHALALRRFSEMAYDLSTAKPVGLLILGKGVREANEINSLLGLGTRKSSTAYNMNLVPSYGYPSSDICFTSKFNGTSSWMPFIPVGRVSAKNDAEVVAYLEKVKVYESEQDQSSVYNKPNKEWQKQVLHFGGGNTGNEQTLFQGYLNNMKNTIENEEFGAKVSSYFKDNTNPFNPVLTSDVNQKIENGVSLMTFFGHGSAGGGFDQNVDNPQNWNNSGKYPIVIGNSCYTGDIFMPNHNSTSEKFVLISNLGAIGFISSTKLGFATYLERYTNELYKEMSLLNYGEAFGQQISNTIQKIQTSNNSFLMETTCTQMTLHGDPLLKTNWHALPEIDLTLQDVFFNPSQFNLATDSIEINVVLTNLGKSITTPFELVVRRNFPNTQIDSVYNVLIPELHYKDTIKIKMPMQPNIGLGLNQFKITADIPSFIPENYDEFGNNEINTTLFINVDGIMPVLPYNYAVVPNDSVVLKASTINPIADFNTYRFEIDTTDLFNSPFRKYAMVSGLGGVKEVFPNQWLNVNSDAISPLVLEDSVAYFWRVAVDSTSPQWVEHSFQYIKDKEGWGQDHFFQFKNGGFTGIDYQRPTRKREFLEIEKVVGCEVYDNASNQTTINQTLWSLDGQMVDYGWCFTTPSIHVAVIDPLTMEPWGTYYNGENPDHQFGNVNNGAACRTQVDYYFIFRQNSADQLQNLQAMLDAVPEGHYILLYTAARAEYGNWQNHYPSIFTTMSNLGATNMTPSSNDRAFIFFTQKGNSDYTTEVHATSSGEFISATIPILGLNNIGIETSTIIGPAAEWQTLFWKQDGLETPNNDETRLIIRGLNANQTVQMEIDTLFTANDSIVNLNNLFPAQQYPYLQLRALYQDTSDLTPAQVDRWHVLYSTIPEAAIDGTNQYTWLTSNATIINEGEDITFAVDVKNISHLDMDSLLIHYWVVDANQTPNPIPYVRQSPLLSGDVLRDTITFSTVGFSGLNSFWMEVNPYTNFPLKDQPELTHFNNLLQIPFNVEPDDLNPLLDVTFDGLHILNGDIINPNAEIVITLKDDNPFLVMNNDADTSLFGVYLRTPDGVQKRVPFINSNGQQIMYWEPANGDNLKFKIMFPAEFAVEGEYELLVQGSDKSGNLSGDLEYRVKFEVLLSSSITHMMNYPNPFSTSTRFVFTLTGSKVPDEIIIQIMTVTGRVVREITEDELGPIRIGRNISQYAWDGRDEFGDQLANGVYLYRVQAQIEGEDIEHRSSGADQHFKKSWGKMYLMR